MKLYYSPGACSLSPHIALLEAGLPFELVKVDTAAKTFAGGDFWQINGKGYVPALELPNGQVLTEGPAIVQYIADQNPDSRLAPKAGTLERYRIQEWLNFITSELHKNFSPLFNKTAAPEWKAGALANITKRLDWLAPQLEGKAFLTGDQFTVADGYLFTILNWTKFVSIDLAKWPSLAAFHARVAARPKVQEALKAEGASGISEKKCHHDAPSAAHDVRMARSARMHESSLTLANHVLVQLLGRYIPVSAFGGFNDTLSVVEKSAHLTPPAVAREGTRRRSVFLVLSLDSVVDLFHASTSDQKSNREYFPRTVAPLRE